MPGGDIQKPLPAIFYLWKKGHWKKDWCDSKDAINKKIKKPIRRSYKEISMLLSMSY